MKTSQIFGLKEEIKISVMRVICYVVGHNEKQIDDVNVNDNEFVSDDLQAKDFMFPIVKHRFKCTRCQIVRETHPDLPGSCSGKYKVHYW